MKGCSRKRGDRARRLVVGWILVTGIGLTACNDSTGVATHYDPHLTADRLDDVLYGLESDYDFLLGLDLAVLTLEYHGAGALAAALSLRPRHEGRLGALRPSPRARPAERGSEHVAEGVPAGDLAPFTLPFGLQGQTLAWDPIDGYVLSGAAGPERGVRFVLYEMDFDTGYPAAPLRRVGHVDILDRDGTQVEAVRVVGVRTTGQTREVADYVVEMSGSGSYAEGEMRLSTRGVVGAAGGVELDLVERMEWSQRRDREQLEWDYQYRTGSRTVQLEAWGEGRFEAPLDVFEFELWLRGASPTTEIDARIRGDDSLHGEIRVDGRRAMLIGGYDGSPSFERADGRSISWSERDALERLWTGISDLIWITDWILVPADLLIAAG